MREKKTVAAFMYDFDNTGRKGFLGGVQYVREKI